EDDGRRHVAGRQRRRQRRLDGILPGDRAVADQSDGHHPRHHDAAHPRIDPGMGPPTSPLAPMCGAPITPPGAVPPPGRGTVVVGVPGGGWPVAGAGVPALPAVSFGAGPFHLPGTTISRKWSLPPVI